MGVNRLEILRLGNKFSSYSGLPSRSAPNGVATALAMTTTGTTANQFAAIPAVTGYQDLWARITVPEQSYVAVGLGLAATFGQLVQANSSILLPVRAGDVVECKDVA